MIKFACPGCSAVFTVGDEKAGKTGKCPKCSAQFEIPEAEPTPQPAAPPPPATHSTSSEVEIEPCPGCQAKLTVASTDLGLEVECPYCKTVYKAKKVGGGSPPAERSERPSRRPADDDRDDDDDRPRRNRRRFEDDEDDDRDDDDSPLDRPRKRRRRSSRRSHSGAVTAVGVLNFVLGGLGLLCSCITLGASSFMRQVFANQRNGPQVDVGFLQTILILIGIFYIFFSVLIITAGFGVVQRRTYGRILTFVTSVLAILAGLASIIGVITNMLAGQMSQAVGGVVAVLIWGGYGIFALITMISHGDEFD